MCDYSLMEIPNRLAAEGEELVAHRFQSGSTGMVACSDFEGWQNRRDKTTFRRLIYGFSPQAEPAPVVCMPPGARLQLTDIPNSLQEKFHLSSCEEATFTQISAEAYRSRDALRFDNGATVMLHLLPEGQKVKVLRLSLPEPKELDRKELVRTL
jgi:hypothetical protein